MFGTLLGALPWPDGVDAADWRSVVDAAVREQEAAGLEPIADGRYGPASPFALGGEAWAAWTSPVSVDGWIETAGRTDRAVKQALPGPYSLARVRARRERDLESMALRIAAGLRREVDALVAAGCPLIEIEETEAHRIGDRPLHRAAFAAAHRRIAEGVNGAHLSLSISGGSAWEAGPDTILAAPYASLAVDLIAGPENWRLVAAAPAERGIVAGALTTRPGDDGPEVLLYAANYAASTEARGLARVGLGTTSGLDRLPWATAVEKLGRLGEAVRIASLPPDEAVRHLDPRAVNARSAALGRVSPSRARRGYHRRP